MTISASSRPRLKPRGLLHSLIPLLGVAALAVGIGVIITRLIGQSDRIRQQQILLAQVESLANHVSALEWQGIGTDSVLDPVIAEFNETRTRAETICAAIRELGPGPESIKVDHLLHAYLRVVGREFDLMRQGRLAEARTLDNTEVDPGFAAFSTAIAEAEHQASKAADQARAQITFLVIGVLVIAAITTAAIVLLLQRRRRTRDHLRIEREVLDRATELFEPEVTRRDAVIASELARRTEIESHYRNLVESVSQGYYVADVRSRFTYCNPALLAMGGFTAADIKGRSCFSLVAAEDRPRVMADYARWLADPAQQSVTCEFRVVTKTGRTFWVEQSTDFPRDAQGRATEGRNFVRDITERREAESQIRESEERFRSIFDHSPMCIALLSVPEGRVVDVNAATISVFGFSREEGLGRTSTELGLWVDLADRDRYLQGLRATGSVAGFETRMRRKNGEIFDALYSGSLVTIGGRPYSLNSIQDITDRKKSESSLRESEERFRCIFDRSPIPIAIAEFPSGRIVAINDAVPLAWGATRENILFRSTSELGLWTDPKDREHAIECMRRDGALNLFEAQIRRGDGRLATVLFSSVIVTLEGRPYSLNTFLDITEQKAAAQARDHLLSLTKATLESTADGILVVDSNGRIVIHNRLFAQMWRISDDILATGQDRLVLEHILTQLSEPQKFVERIQQFYGDLLAEGSDTIQFIDGRVFERYTRPHLVDGQSVGRVWSFRDVTARVRAEEQRAQLEVSIRQAQKLDSLGTLAGGIAHDFNNILTGMFGFAELARAELPADHSARVWLDEVTACSRRAKELVRQILAFSRKGETVRAPQRLDNVIGEALRLLRSTLPAMIELDVQLTPQPSAVLADPTQIHQVIMNLCTNAWHALPDAGGRISVRLDPINLTPAHMAVLPDITPGPYLLLSIGDNGSGMSAATLEHIFEPFFTTKETGKGTGLGLAVVHGIIKSHGAAITVRSTPGVGTTFNIYFPVIASPASLPPVADVADGPFGRSERILVVDDDFASGFALEKVAESLHYRVKRFSDPREALAHFEQCSADYDLVTVDLAMPSMPGDLLAREITRIRADIPIALISGYVDHSREAELTQAGIRAILRKPPTRKEIAELLRRLLDQASSASPTSNPR